MLEMLGTVSTCGKSLRFRRSQMYFLSLSSSHFHVHLQGSWKFLSLNGLVFLDRANILAFLFSSEFWTFTRPCTYVHVNTIIEVFFLFFGCFYVIRNSSLISRDIILNDSTITPRKAKLLLRAKTNNLGFQEEKCELPNHSSRI